MFSLILFLLLTPLLASGESIFPELSAPDDEIPSSPTTTAPLPSCYTKGSSWSSQESTDMITDVESLYSCQELCGQSGTCTQFTWYDEQAFPLKFACFLFDHPTTEHSCYNCISGPQSCTCSGYFSCQYTEDNFVGEVPHVQQEVLCHDQCFKIENCAFYSWFDGDFHPFPNLCLMFSSCEEKDFSCNTCHSGPPHCTNVSVITSTTTTTTTITTTETSTSTTSTTTPLTTTTYTSTTTVHPYSNCFSLGVSWTHNDMIVPPLPADDAYSCQRWCVNETRCTAFTFYPHNNVCLLFDHPTNVTDDRHDCWSGPKFCTCSYHGSCTNEGGNLVDTVMDVLEEDWCRQLCYENILCTVYTWFDMTADKTKHWCHLFSTCEELDLTCQGCFTGPPVCNNSNCDHLPEPQNHGDWFCSSSNKAITCHLECHPGYVSTNGTVITCQNGEWSSAPTCVTSVAIITGGDPSSSWITVEVYGEGVHKRMENLNDDRYYHSQELVDSVLLLCGGGYGSPQTSCLEFTASGQWTSHSTTKYPRYHHSSVSMLGQLHLLGGRDSSSKSTTELLSPPTHNWNNGWDLLESTYSACATKIEPEVLIVTGGGGHHSSVVSYNGISGVATRLQDLITPSYRHGCVYVRNAHTGFRGVIVAGGNDGNNFLSRSEVYDIKTGMWSATGHLTNERQGVSLVVLGENILALGGYDGGSYLSTVDRFNLTTRMWTATEEMLVEREYHAVSGVPPSAVGLFLN